MMVSASRPCHADRHRTLPTELKATLVTLTLLTFNGLAAELP
jgi:hypothetical protein